MTENEDVKFAGFPIPQKNFFHMPNNWTDVTAQINSLSELKVIEYVARHTWGYQEYGISKTITTDEFMDGRKRADGSRIDIGTKLSNRSVIDGLRRAEEHGYLECIIDNTDKARIVKSYRLKMSVEVAVKIVHSDCEQSSQPSEIRCEQSSQLDVNNLHSDCEQSSQRSEKETLERSFRKTTNTPPGDDSAETNSINSLIVDSQKEIVSQAPQEKPQKLQPSEALKIAKEMLASLSEREKAVLATYKQCNPYLNIARSLPQQEHINRFREALEDYATSPLLPTVEEFEQETAWLKAIDRPSKDFKSGFYKSVGVKIWDLSKKRQDYFDHVKAEQAAAQRAANAAPKKKTRQPTYEELRASKEGI